METIPAKTETRTIACPLCEEQDFSPRLLARDRLHGISGTFSYVSCAGCQVLYMNPQVDSSKLDSLYPATYAPYSAAAPSARRTIRDRILEMLKICRLDSWIARELNPQSRVLDVGCANGTFLKMVRDRTGAQVFGIDLSQTAADQARERYQIPVEVTTTEKTHFPDESFDLITAWWYLEHVPNPREVLATLACLLKPGGRMVIGVPNFRSANRVVFGECWHHLDCPRHLVLWSPSHLKEELNKVGLINFRTRFDLTPWGLVGSLQYLIFGDNFNPKTKDRLRSNRLVLALLLPFSLALGWLHLSDIIVVYAQKPDHNA